MVVLNALSDSEFTRGVSFCLFLSYLTNLVKAYLFVVSFSMVVLHDSSDVIFTYSLNLCMFSSFIRFTEMTRPSLVKQTRT